MRFMSAQQIGAIHQHAAGAQQQRLDDQGSGARRRLLQRASVACGRDGKGKPRHLEQERRIGAG